MPVRRETTEGSSIEFIAYRMPQPRDLTAQGYSQGMKSVGLLRYSDWLSRYPHLKFKPPYQAPHKTFFGIREVTISGSDMPYQAEKNCKAFFLRKETI